MSNMSTFMRANFPLEDRQKCTCGVQPEDHSKGRPDKEQTLAGDKAFAAYFGKFLAERHLVRHDKPSSPLVAHTGPTEEALRPVEAQCPDGKEQSRKQEKQKQRLKKKKDQVKFVGEMPDDGPKISAYPTDQRLRDKARKANNGEKKEVKRKKQVVEQVFDDCEKISQG